MTIQINHLSLETLEGRPLISDLSFSLQPGDRLAIIGEEGNGKSTLIRALCDPQKISSYIQLSGQIMGIKAPIPYLHQTLLESELSLSTMEFMETMAPFPYQDHWADIYRFASFLHLPESVFENNRPIKSLSGGERIKIQILVLLLVSPPIWVLDEPTNDLDLRTLMWLEDFCLSVSQPLIFVSHDELFLHHVATRVIHLEQLRKKQLPRHMVANVPYRLYVQQRMDAMEKQSQLAFKERQEKEQKEMVLHKFRSKLEHQLRLAVRQPTWGRLLAKKMKVVKSQEKKLKEAPLTEFPESEDAINVFFSEIEPLNPTKRIIELQGDSLKIGGRILVNSINITIVGKDHLAIVGENGVGKTTLLKVFQEKLREIGGLKIAYFPQHYQELLVESETPVEFLSKNYGSKKEQLTRIRSLLGALHLTTDEMDYSIAKLSGGQKAKIVLLSLVLGGPNVLLLDEPTRNFSPLSAPEIRYMLKKFPGCLIMVTHDRLLIDEVADQVFELTPNGLNELLR